MNIQTAITKIVYLIVVTLMCVIFYGGNHLLMAGLGTTGFALVVMDWG